MPTGDLQAQPVTYRYRLGAADHGEQEGLPRRQAHGREIADGNMPAPCNALLVMTGPDGTALASMSTGALMPGNATLLAFNANMLRPSFGQRVDVWAS